MNVVRVLASCLADLTFVQMEDQIVKSSRMQAIPPCVYQTWETRDFGRKHARAMSQFRRLNDDLNFYLFDKSQRDEYMQAFWGDRLISEMYLRSQFGALKADIFRYCLIQERGGYYFDISKGLDTKISSLHKAEAAGIISYENNPFQVNTFPSSLLHPLNLAVQWGFGFSPLSPLLDLHIRRIEANFENFLGRVFPNPKQAILELSGPIAFTLSLHEFASVKQDDFEKIQQLGIDFNGHGIFSLPGSGSRYLRSPGYANSENQPILI